VRNNLGATTDASDGILTGQRLCIRVRPSFVPPPEFGDSSLTDSISVSSAGRKGMSNAEVAGLNFASVAKLSPRTKRPLLWVRLLPD
jgi:hypothetical protein